MATMSMNRVIHAAFRRDLDRFEGALTTFPTGDARRAQQLGAAWDNFDQQLTDHHEGEHEIAWPALEQVGVTRATIEQMDAEHGLMAEALATTRSAMAALRTSPGPGEAERALDAMRRLREVTIAHLDHEEQEIEPLYLQNEQSPAIKDMGRKFAKVSPAKGGQFFAWLTDGAAQPEREALAASVPPPVMKVIVALFGRRYRKQVAPAWKG
jgi:hemerythrin-like domain-containing protein